MPYLLNIKYNWSCLQFQYSDVHESIEIKYGRISVKIFYTHLVGVSVHQKNQII